MEIDKTFPTFKKIYHNLVDTYSNINTYKEIFLYLLGVAIYLLLNRDFTYKIVMCTLRPIIELCVRPDDNLDKMAILFFIFLVTYHYLSAKLCGLFKKINHLNIFLTILIIAFVDILLNISINTRVQLYPTIKIGYDGVKLNNILFFSELYFFTTFNFIVFKFFNFLAKKFPMPFEKIGYYTSIEFMKDIIKKIKSIKR